MKSCSMLIAITLKHRIGLCSILELKLLLIDDLLLDYLYIYAYTYITVSKYFCILVLKIIGTKLSIHNRTKMKFELCKIYAISASNNKIIYI